VKIASSLLHKTELDGVRTGIRSEAELFAAMDAVAANAGAETAFLVQEFVDGVEIIAGAREDEQFGPVLLVGLGGIAAEVLRDVVIRLLPARTDDVREMLASLRGRALLGAFRGRPERDLDAIARAAAGLGATFLACRPWLTSLEINPLVAGAAGAGARAVDLRFTTEGLL
jgi:acetate---CoA ligase (ADP-forming)